MTSKARSKAADIVKLTDLAPRRTVVGGSERRIFGSPDKSEPEVAASKRTGKDLPAVKPVKGGRLAGNDNMTLVRAGQSGRRVLQPRQSQGAKPMARPKKDLPAKKTVKGGLKRA